MLKFHIDLAEEAAKTLRTNFLEANLKAVIYSTALTLALSDALTFFLHLASLFIAVLSTHPFALRQFPRLQILPIKNMTATVH